MDQGKFMNTLFGGIEAGGTKFVCIVASGPDKIVDQARIPTTGPDETLEKTIQFFEPFTKTGQVDAIGVGCFGPLDLDPASPPMVSSPPCPSRAGKTQTCAARSNAP
jgi:fructokinase